MGKRIPVTRSLVAIASREDGARRTGNPRSETAPVGRRERSPATPLYAYTHPEKGPRVADPPAWSPPVTTAYATGARHFPEAYYAPRRNLRRWARPRREEPGKSRARTMRTIRSFQFSTRTRRSSFWSETSFGDFSSPLRTHARASS